MWTVVLCPALLRPPHACMLAGVVHVENAELGNVCVVTCKCSLSESLVTDQTQVLAF